MTSQPPKPAHYYAATRDWPGYFDAMANTPPRETLLKALDLFDAEGLFGASDAASIAASRTSHADAPLAIDLGCGEGRDTVELLRRGYRVLATDNHPDAIPRLLARANLSNADRLTTSAEPFENLVLPPAHLVNASFALPFCSPAHFDALWNTITAALTPHHGRFAGQLFGSEDSWATLPDRTHHSRAQVDRLFAGFTIEYLHEEKKPSTDRVHHPKFWHVFHIVARKNKVPQ